MPNRKISKRVFTRFIMNNGWMEIYYNPYQDLIRYITPTGIQVDTVQKDNMVEVMTDLWKS